MVVAVAAARLGVSVFDTTPATQAPAPAPAAETTAPPPPQPVTTAGTVRRVILEPIDDQRIFKRPPQGARSTYREPLPAVGRVVYPLKRAHSDGSYRPW